jgi:uncharacterized protein
MHDTYVPIFEGFGLGLRPTHFNQFLERDRLVDFVEIISENFLVRGGRPLYVLERVRKRYPVAMHGVSLSVGSADGLKEDYLKQLKGLADRIDPLWVSDHLCWTGLEGFNSHDLLPLPYTEEALDIVCRNITQAQETLQRPILLENPSSYLTFADNQMPEWEFIDAMCRRTGCYLLLDVNNIYVSGKNHGFDPFEYLEGIPVDRVRQMHLAGHSVGKNLLIDTHDESVPAPVWSLYQAACKRFGSLATLIERDDNIPPLRELLAELDIARQEAGVLLSNVA